MKCIKITLFSIIACLSMHNLPSSPVFQERANSISQETFDISIEMLAGLLYEHGIIMSTTITDQSLIDMINVFTQQGGVLNQWFNKKSFCEVVDLEWDTQEFGLNSPTSLMQLFATETHDVRIVSILLKSGYNLQPEGLFILKELARQHSQTNANPAEILPIMKIVYGASDVATQRNFLNQHPKFGRLIK